MKQLRKVEDIEQEFEDKFIHGLSDVNVLRNWLHTTLTQDRKELVEVICEVLEGKKNRQKIGYDLALKDAQAAIRHLLANDK